MKVILVKDVKKVGKKDDVIDVSEGYARNFLLRNHLAEVLTDTALQQINSARQRNASRTESEARGFKAQLDKIASQVYYFDLPGDKTGHLYAGLKESEILAKITEGGATLKKRLSLADYSPIKTSGEHQITARVHGAGAKTLKIFIKNKS